MKKMEEINKLINELEQDIKGTEWYGRNAEEIEDALITLNKLKQAINYSQCCMGEAEQLFCSCGSRKVKTTGGSQCTNNRCSL